MLTREDNKKLIEYIKEQRGLGRFPTEIRDSLTLGGWDGADINKAFLQIKEEQNKKPSPVKKIVVIVVALVLLGSVFFWFKTPIIGWSSSLISNLVNPVVVELEVGDVILDPVATTTQSGQLGTTTNPALEEPEIVSERVSPRESYLEMKAKFDDIKVYSDLEEFYLEYGSEKRLSEFKEESEKMNSLPDSFKKQVVSLLVSSVPSIEEITKITEKIDGDEAILSASGITTDLKGTIKLVWEDDQWKLESELWIKK